MTFIVVGNILKLKEGEKMQSVYELHLKYANEENPVGCNVLRCYQNGRVHFHDSLELLYFIEGDCNIINGSDEIKAQKGDIIIFNSGDIHCVNCGEKTAKYIILQIGYKFCEGVGFRFWDYTFKKKIVDSKIEFIVKNIHTKSVNKNKFYLENIKVKTLELLLELFENYVVENPQNLENNSKMKITKDIIKYIQSHSCEPITVEQIAKYYGYTRFHISRVFKEVTGATVLDYINSIKVEQAKKLLKKSDDNIGEIALKCGFSNQGYFCKVFKKYENTSPFEYRKNTKKSVVSW